MLAASAFKFIVDTVSTFIRAREERVGVCALRRQRDRPRVKCIDANRRLTYVHANEGSCGLGLSLSGELGLPGLVLPGGSGTNCSFAAESAMAACARHADRPALPGDATVAEAPLAPACSPGSPLSCHKPSRMAADASGPNRTPSSVSPVHRVLRQTPSNLRGCSDRSEG